jgi:hypothetical protein
MHVGYASYNNHFIQQINASLLVSIIGKNKKFTERCKSQVFLILNTSKIMKNQRGC